MTTCSPIYRRTAGIIEMQVRLTSAYALLLLQLRWRWYCYYGLPHQGNLWLLPQAITGVFCGAALLRRFGTRSNISRVRNALSMYSQYLLGSAHHMCGVPHPEVPLWKIFHIKLYPPSLATFREVLPPLTNLVCKVDGIAARFSCKKH